ncbi:MAG: hypothetical protein EOM50_20500 [Erysipelotrichia bacterium]|nr:hypothetical protein [Erysipelotrichia bacterium]
MIRQIKKHKNNVISKSLNLTSFRKYVFLFLLASVQLFSDATNWQTIVIPNICTFEIPNTMEIQAGTYKKISDKLAKEVLEINLNESSVVAQQKGLNEFGKEGFKNYSRIIVETEYGKLGDYEKINTRIVASKKELQVLDVTIKNDFLTEAEKMISKGMNMKLLSWKPVKIETINGISMIKSQYTRTMDDKPEVMVMIFLIQNNDRLHKVTISYRISEEKLWKNDLEKVIYSFKFNPINK